LMHELERIPDKIAVHLVPTLCPLAVSPFDFSVSRDLIERAAKSSKEWIAGGGLHRQARPQEVAAHRPPWIYGLTECLGRYAYTRRSIPLLRWTAYPILFLALALGAGAAFAQIPPSSEQIARYAGLHAAAARGDVAGIALLRATGADPNQRDA